MQPKKPLRMLVPRLIPDTRQANGCPGAIDPREQAQAPTHTPSMERINRQEQMQVRAMAKTVPQDNVLGSLMSQMAHLHGTNASLDNKPDSNEDAVQSTPSSPTKPRGSINIPISGKLIMSEQSKPTPPMAKKVKYNTVPKFTAKQHMRNQLQKKLAVLASSPSIRRERIRTQARKPVGTRKVGPQKQLVKVGEPLDLIKDLHVDDNDILDNAIVDIHYLFGTDETEEEQGDGQDSKTENKKKEGKKANKRVNKPHKTRIIYDSDTDSVEEDTMTAGSMTISGGSDTISITPGNERTAHSNSHNSILEPVVCLMNKYCYKPAYTAQPRRYLTIGTTSGTKAIYVDSNTVVFCLLHCVVKHAEAVYKRLLLTDVASVCSCNSRISHLNFVGNTLDTTQEATVTSTKTDAEPVLVTTEIYRDAEGKNRIS